MAKDRRGLQKRISTIFTGVQVPKEENRQLNSAPESGPTEYVPSKLIPPSRQTLTAPVIQRPDSSRKMSGPSASVPRKIERSKPPKLQTVPKIRRQPAWEKLLQKVTAKLLAPKPGVDPRRQKLMVVVIPVLVIVLAVVLFQVFKSPNAGGAGKQAGSGSLDGKNVADGKVDWKIPPPYPSTMRDPMQFGRSTQQADEGMRPAIRGIVYSEENPSAIIGQDIVFEGGTVMGATVVKINPNSVEFAKGDEKWTQEVER